jgi:hypothetical protein
MAQNRHFVQLGQHFFLYFSHFLRQVFRLFFNNSENAFTPDLAYCKMLQIKRINHWALWQICIVLIMCGEETLLAPSEE